MRNKRGPCFKYQFDFGFCFQDNILRPQAYEEDSDFSDDEASSVESSDRRVLDDDEEHSEVFVCCNVENVLWRAPV
jgi:hypothetical protein